MKYREWKDDTAVHGFLYWSMKMKVTDKREAQEGQSQQQQNHQALERKESE